MHEPSLPHLQRLKSPQYEQSSSVGFPHPFSDGLVAQKGEAPPIHRSPLAALDGTLYGQHLFTGSQHPLHALPCTCLVAHCLALATVGYGRNWSVRTC